MQVKALREAYDFPISHDRIERNHVYVFVRLKVPGESVEYYVVPGKTLADRPASFGKWFTDKKFPGISVKHLREFADAWEVFEKKAT